MNDLDKYIHRCRLNLEPHHLQPADETDDKHCIICDISGARRHIRMDGLCINCWLKWRRKHAPAKCLYTTKDAADQLYGEYGEETEVEE